MKRKNAHMLLIGLSLSLSLLLSSCKNEEHQVLLEQIPVAKLEEKRHIAEDGTPGSKVKPAKFTVFLNYDWYTVPKWGVPPQTKWIREQLRVDIEPIQSNGTAAPKLNAMAASKTLPDVIFLDRGKDVDRLQQSGLLVPLDDYLKTYPEFVQTVGEKNIKRLRSSDGKLYQIPNWFVNGNNGTGNAAYIIEKKIYKALGSPKLETFDDLETYLKRVKMTYPDVVPMDSGELRDGSELQMLGMIYSGYGGNRTPAYIAPGTGQVFGIPQGSELNSIYEDTAFLDSALFVNRLYRQGLTSIDLFSETRDQIMEKLKVGKIAVFAAYDAVVEIVGREANNTLAAKDPEDGYEAIWPLHKEGVDRNHVYPSSYSTLGWNVNVITRNAKDPEAIFSYYNWLASPQGQQVAFFGPPGLFYDKVEDGVPIPNDAYIHRDPKNYDELKIGEYDWAGNTSYVDDAKGKREKLLPAKAQDWTTKAQTSVSFKTSLNLTDFANLDPAPSSEEGIIMQRLKDLYKQLIPRMIFAKSEEEVKTHFRQAAQESQKLGYDKVLKFKTMVWRNNLKKSE